MGRRKGSLNKKTLAKLANTADINIAKSSLNIPAIVDEPGADIEIKKFEVDVTESWYRNRSYTVEALDEDNAKEIALRMLSDEPWQASDLEYEDNAVLDCREITE